MTNSLAYFAMGCFWKPEYIFSKIKGVISTQVGYSGGRLKTPTYESVCGGKTGHVETLKIEFNPNKITYESLLDIFWKNHDPTQINKQGLDIGKQYRSMIFYTTSEQKKIAMDSKKKAQKGFRKKIITYIKKLKEFYPAEEYHQRYIEKTGKNMC